MPINTPHASLPADDRAGPCPKLTQAQLDFIGCLIPALFTALPVFLESFMGCISGIGPGPSDTYDPGDRTRCA